MVWLYLTKKLFYCIIVIYAIKHLSLSCSVTRIVILSLSLVSDP